MPQPPPAPSAASSGPAAPAARRGIVVGAIGLGQTIAWASSYYLPAILARPIAASLGVAPATVFAAFSAALLLSAALGPAVGRYIDRHGGRGVLALSNLVLAAGLGLLAAAQGPVGLFAAWAVLGVGMTLGLYDSAFATLAGLYGRLARSPITGVTLIAGFASTVGWPATAGLEELWGWRAACLVWAGVHLAVGLPLNRLLVPKAPPPAAVAAQEGEAAPAWPGAMAVLAFVFAAAWFVTAAMAAHLPALLTAAGATPAAAIAAAALVGPAQVAARLVEFGLLRRLHPLTAGRVATALHPVGAATLVVVGAPAAAAFALLHGAGNGLLTIAKGTIPLALFGPVGYGRRSGILSAAARVTQAAAPFLFGLVLDAHGPGMALGLSSALCLAALAGLLALRERPPASRRQ
ncbi:MAG: MFS transporter [Alphaproteobacteria bacterium]